MNQSIINGKQRQKTRSASLGRQSESDLSDSIKTLNPDHGVEDMAETDVDASEAIGIILTAMEFVSS